MRIYEVFNDKQFDHLCWAGDRIAAGSPKEAAETLYGAVTRVFTAPAYGKLVFVKDTVNGRGYIYEAKEGTKC